MTTATVNMVRLADADCMGEAELSELSIDQLRCLYRRYRKCALYLIDAKEVDAQLARFNPKSPVEWVMAIRSVRGDCPRCRGEGIYYWGACVNGKMTHSAPCARCNGTGRVGNDDCRRAYVYDNFAIARALGF